MGKIVAIAIVVGLAYAWHKGMLDDLLSRRTAALQSPASTSKAPYDPHKRYGVAEESPEARCASARAKLDELEAWSRGKSGVIDAGTQDGALEQARRAVAERCRGQ